MSNLKWADVAHYYLESGIRLETEIFGRFTTIGIKDRFAGVDESKTKPILRALEDMTEGEARELYLFGFGQEFVPSFDWDSAKEVIDDQCQRFDSGVFHWPISKGFDVFGLIESGQAIRKGVEGA